MTKEQYLKRYNDLNSQVENLKAQMNLIKSKYITRSPFKVGDRVKVTVTGAVLSLKMQPKEFILYIARVDVKRGGNFRYDFYREKKDGTPSKQTAYMQFYDTIELLPVNAEIS